MDSTREKGNASEQIAADFLISKGYQILERNWYFGHNEIDIVAQQADILVIAEVRSLYQKSFQEPYQSVTRTKQKSLITAANAYITKHKSDSEVRFDIISILWGKGKPEIEHIENAFYPIVR